MARKDDFAHTVIHCCMCGDPIPEGRPKMALTCSDACRDARKNYRRSRQDQRACRYCLHPSTPEERKRYQRWRRWEKLNPPPPEPPPEPPQEEHDGDTASSAD